jgi:hypothetical protein
MPGRRRGCNPRSFGLHPRGRSGIPVGLVGRRGSRGPNHPPTAPVIVSPASPEGGWGCGAQPHGFVLVARILKGMDPAANVPGWVVPPGHEVAGCREVANGLESIAGAAITWTLDWVTGSGRPGPVTRREESPPSVTVAQVERITAAFIAEGTSVTPDLFPAALGVPYRAAVHTNDEWVRAVERTLGWVLGLDDTPPLRLSGLTRSA